MFDLDVPREIGDKPAANESLAQQNDDCDLQSSKTMHCTNNSDDDKHILIFVKSVFGVASLTCR
jgi:hypothetical protein